MPIIGIGTDIVEIKRFEQLLARRGEQFKKRIFTNAEIQLGEWRNNLSTFFAGRWAAKEACAKALGSGIGGDCSFTDIEILNDNNGRPKLQLSGAGKKTLSRIGGKYIHISISHERSYAVATVIISK